MSDERKRPQIIVADCDFSDNGGAGMAYQQGNYDLSVTNTKANRNKLGGMVDVTPTSLETFLAQHPADRDALLAALKREATSGTEAHQAAERAIDESGFSKLLSAANMARASVVIGLVQIAQAAGWLPRV